MPLIRPRPRGVEGQHGRRPVSRGAVQRLLLLSEPKLRWSFRMKQVDACASFRLYSWPRCGLWLFLVWFSDESPLTAISQWIYR
jgi:hypothetical protein